jgi:undecaprenyl-diphosphatase
MAMLVVRAFVRFISRHGFTVFAWYRIAIGSLALIFLYF